MFNRFRRIPTSSHVKRSLAVSFDGYGKNVFRGAIAAPYLEKQGLPKDILNTPAWTTSAHVDKV
jgi:hypothetical protein